MSSFATASEHCTAILNRLRQQFQEQCRDSFAGLFKAFFAEFPEVKTIYWAQWVPGFNDGDPCHFTLGEVNFSPVAADDIDGPHFDDEHEDRALSNFETYGADDRVSTDLKAAMMPMRRILANLSDYLEMTYGSNAFVRMDRNGATVETYDCGH